ncbi:MAG: CxxC-x17-CxxC domain-containing protein [Candidatus Altiarchaeota archaeon]
MKFFNRGRSGRGGVGFPKEGRVRPGGGGGFGKAGRIRSGDGGSGGDDGRYPGPRGSGRPERRDFRGSGRSGPDMRFSGGFKGEQGGKPKLQLHKAVCDKCRQKCEVPFKPAPGKPVFCLSCYKGDEKKRPSNIGEELARINEKLDRIMQALHLG